MNDKLSKMKNVWQKYGFIGCVKKSFHYVTANYGFYFNWVGMIKFQFYRSKYQKELKEIFFTSHYDRIIIWRSSFGWNVPLFQRPQHISNHLSQQNCLVLYEVTSMTDDVSTISKIQDNLYLVNFKNHLFSKLLMKEVKNVNRPKYLQFYSTDWTLTVSDIQKYQEQGFKILYEYIDDIHPALAGTKELPRNVREKYDYAMSHPDDVLIVVTADLLKEDVLKHRGDKNLAFSSNGVDYDFFQTIDSEYSYEDEFVDILKKGQVTVGYYGALANWFDYELLKKVADTGQYQIILFGIKYDDAFDKAGINHYPNIHFLGSKDYQVLKNYASKIDILTIPFLINDITKATSPVKIFEYMALHKPIVTTDMNECRKYRSVFIGKDHQEFLQCLEKANAKKNDKKYIQLLDREARDNDWRQKATSIVNLLRENE